MGEFYDLHGQWLSCPVGNADVTKKNVYIKKFANIFFLISDPQLLYIC